MELKFRELKANEIDIRVGRVIQTDKYSGVSLLLYKDARVDQEILDATVGALNWQRKHTRDNANCLVGIYDKDKNEWVWKEDTGTESNNEAEKGLASDSFKRACVNWGIGRALYTAPCILVECELTEKGKVKNGISWVVEEIEYVDNVISLLVIREMKYEKKGDIVFTFGKNKEGKTDKKKEEQLNLTEEEIQKLPFDVPGHKKAMTLEEAFNIEVNMKDGYKKLKDLDDATLERVIKHTVVPEWKEGANLILTHRGGQKK